MFVSFVRVVREFEGFSGGNGVFMNGVRRGESKIFITD